MQKMLRLATRDYFHEWHISICYVLALATVLGPMLTLFGLKYGIVGNMLAELIEEPRNRELHPVNSGRYDNAWFKVLKKRSDVDFMIPRTRNIAASIQLKSKQSPLILNIELLPTTVNDPLLPKMDIPIKGMDWLILSKSAASKLAVKPGDKIDASIARRYQNVKQRVHHTIKVHSIAPDSAFNREGAFVALELLDAIEDYRDGHAVPALRWSGDKPREEGYYTGFRLFAKTIYDVTPLKQWLEDQGIDIRTRDHEITVVKRLDQTLSGIYWAIAFISILGFSASLGANLWANIDRKRKELSTLRLVGFGSTEIIFFPLIQSLITAILGWSAALVIYQLSSYGINQFIVSEIETNQRVCYLMPRHYVLSLVLTCLSSLLASLFAGVKSAKIEPADGLRTL